MYIYVMEGQFDNNHYNHSLRGKKAYKIGYSACPEERVRSVSRDRDVNAKLVYKVRATDNILEREGLLHLWYRDLHLYGEWFDLDCSMADLTNASFFFVRVLDHVRWVAEHDYQIVKVMTMRLKLTDNELLEVFNGLGLTPRAIQDQLQIVINNREQELYGEGL